MKKIVWPGQMPGHTHLSAPVFAFGYAPTSRGGATEDQTPVATSPKAMRVACRLPAGGQNPVNPVNPV